jgi:hypothetical protein
MRGLTACSSGLLPLAVAAAPWYVEPTVTVLATYQSNPQFYVGREHSGSGELATLDLPFEWSDERASATIHPTANAGTTRGATGLGEHNRSVNGQWNWGYDHGSLRANGELARLDLFGSTNVDLGLVRPVGYAVNESYGAGTTYSPDERVRLDLDATRQISAYHVSKPSNYVDYMYSQLAGQWSYSTSERTQAIVTANYGDFAPDTGGLGSRDHSLQVGGSHQFSDSLKLTGTFGKSRVKLARDGSFKNGTVYSGTLAWSHPVLSMQLTARQSQQPGAIGNLRLTTEVSGSATVQHSERLSVSLNAQYSKVNDSYVGFALYTRNYLNADLSARYFFTPQWHLDLHLNRAQAKTPATIYTPTSLSASSIGGSVGVARAFGRTRLN